MSNQLLTDLFLRKKGVDRLCALRDHYVKEKASAILKMEESQAYLDRKDEVLSVLNELHLRTQFRTKEIYEQLLTTLVHEIKPGDPENDRVVLETDIKRNETTLEIGMRNDKGSVRNIYLDKGGSVENIVAMGLRFIAVSRTANRRITIMDEADSALRSEYIPMFATIMNQLARQIGMQVIYISHHPVSSFEGKARIIHLERADGCVMADQVSDITASHNENLSKKLGNELDEDADMMQGIGLRYIRLINIKQHENTLIELSPYVNVITADIDVGKSTVVQAIEAVAHNLGREGLIRDGQPFGKVEIGLEDGMTLQWSYARKGSKKTRYLLTDGDGEIIQESDQGNHAPEWLHDYLGMSRQPDFDLHISDQHNSSFLLDKRISPQRRAELLSLGKEATQVQRMISLHLKRAKHAASVVKDQRTHLQDVKNKLIALRPLSSAEEKIEELTSLQQAITSEEKNNEWLKKNFSVLETLTKKHKILSQVSSITVPSCDDIIDTTGISKAAVLLKKLSEKQAILSHVTDFSIPVSPELTDVSAIRNAGLNMQRLASKQQLLSQVNAIVIPAPIECIPVSELLDAGKKIGAALNKKQWLNAEIRQQITDRANSLKERQELIDKLGGECPVCQQTLSKEHEHEH